MTRTVFANLPLRIRGVLIEYDNYTTIMLNARYTNLKKTYLHEIDHIENDDFRSEKSATVIEKERHGLR